MSRVFVSQVPARWDRQEGCWREKFDLSPAEEHGELIALLPYGNVADDADTVKRQIADGLASFDASKDSVLLLGDPVLIACIGAFMGERGEDFVTLKYERRSDRYVRRRIAG